MKYGHKGLEALLGGLVLLAALALVAQAEGCVQPPAGLVSWWPGDRTAGDGIADDLAGGNNGDLNGGATFARGQVGKAFLLDGNGAFVNLGNDPSLHVSGGDFTVDVWANFKSLGRDMPIVDKMFGDSSGPNVDGWRLLKQRDDHFWFCLGGGSENGCVPGSPTTVRSESAAVIDRWYHVAAVKTANDISIYVNGVLEATTQLGTFIDTNVSTDLLIGSSVQPDQGMLTFLDGLVDEVEIYNRALTANEILAIYNAGAEGKCTIDIKPGTFPNIIDRGSPGLIQVAILSSAGFDAPNDADRTSLTFGSTGNETSLEFCNSTRDDDDDDDDDAVNGVDVNGDGSRDLVCYFDASLAGFQPGDTRGVLKGSTRSGTFRLTDLVHVVAVHEETRTGKSTAALTVTSDPLTRVTGALYLAAISTKPNVQVEGVTGLGLAWTLVTAQCSGRAQTRVEVWMAQDTLSGNGEVGDTVTATLASTPKMPLSAVIAVSRYSGGAVASPINTVSGNTNLVPGPCLRVVDTTADTAAYSIDLTTTVDGAVVYGAVAKRHRTHKPGAGYRERADFRKPEDVFAPGALPLPGDSAGIAVEDRIVPSVSSSVPVNGSFNGTVDWAVVGIEIMPQ